MFNHSDLVCKHCGKLANKENADLLLKTLNEFQEFLGPHNKIIINSAYRCKEYNSAIGSKDTSQHIKSLAGDIKILYYTSEMMFKRAKEFGKWQAVGLYNNFIHCDLRKIPIIIWDNRNKRRKKLFPLTSSS